MLRSQCSKLYGLAAAHMSHIRRLTEGAMLTTPLIQPELYATKNSIQAIDNRRLLEVFQPTFRVPQNETQQYLDIGCGTGDFTRDGLLPRCRPCRRLVGIDCSPAMIQYARKHSAQRRLDFHELDIGGDVEAFVCEFGQFDRVYSFFCLHWLVDQAKGLKNIARLLKQSGECLITSCTSHQGVPIWTQLAGMDRWAKYSEELKRFIPQTEGMSGNEMILSMSKWLAEAGLAPSTLEISRSSPFSNGTLEDCIGMHIAVVPIINIVTEEEKPQLVADVTELAARVHAPNSDQSSYKFFIIKATKILDVYLPEAHWGLSSRAAKRLRYT